MASSVRCPLDFFDTVSAEKGTDPYSLPLYSSTLAQALGRARSRDEPERDTGIHDRYISY